MSFSHFNINIKNSLTRIYKINYVLAGLLCSTKFEPMTFNGPVQCTPFGLFIIIVKNFLLIYSLVASCVIQMVCSYSYC